MSHDTRFFTSSDGLRLAFRDEGAGVPLLCLTGLTRNMSDFDPIVDMFRDRTRLIRMDYRGRGASDHAADYTSYAIPREAQDAVELMDHLGLARAAILGTSRGGLIAMTLAVTAPERISGAILVDIGPEIAPQGLAAIMGYLGRPPGFATYDAAAASHAEQQSPRFVGVPPETWQRHVRRLYQATPDGLALRYDPRLRDAVLEAGAKGPAPDLWPFFDALASIGPLALIRGTNSDLLSEATARQMQGRAPAMLFAEVPGRGHVPFLDEPEAVDLLARAIDQLQ